MFSFAIFSFLSYIRDAQHSCIIKGAILTIYYFNVEQYYGTLTIVRLFWRIILVYARFRFLIKILKKFHSDSKSAVRKKFQHLKVFCK